MNMLIKRYDFVFKWLKFLGAIVIAILLPARPLPKLQEYYLTNMPFLGQNMNNGESIWPVLPGGTGRFAVPYGLSCTVIWAVS